MTDNTPLKIIFAGTPEFAAEHLRALIDSCHDVVAVYTQPDKPAGRGKQLTQSAVKQLALAHNLPVLQPKSLRNEAAQRELAQLNADVMVVVAYGLLLPQAVLDAPHFGCLNVHGSLLPKWRGAAPIQRAVWAGDEESGVTIMQMDAGLDTGAMLHKVCCPIDAKETAASLYEKLAGIAPSALLTVLDGLREGAFPPVAQDEEHSTYAKKLSKEEAKLDWAQSAVSLERCIRAFNPWPISYFPHEVQGKVHNIKVYQADVLPKTQSAVAGTVLAFDKRGLQVACGEGVLNITMLQPPGKKPMSVADFANGRADWFHLGQVLA
ncbi:methionyl-tRNA formyltransferase [Pasteurellaceae bacterium HPA106]|uniref:methionyl-tRNA formyltransferase n=1 Tax=Spirabiliibacterium pneumoniae TaxID=221400 RepID=UPI001AAE0470|nr:methionyl-tRNA formyltransferase [Spirabiliibacterium pneumoniae]MBE2897001.1 methionyl-tRNA formyltransferase [Spirabiliibacterium pneumoniae]